jgi:glucosamine-phosphate N-acetyltransferase
MIRPLHITDYDAIVYLLKEKYGKIVTKDEFIGRLKCTHSGYFIFETNGIIVGLVKYILELKFSPDKKHVGHIEDLFVHDSFRNNGYGRLLVNHCLEFLKNNDCYKIILNCKTHLVQFYSQFGFESNQHCMTYMNLK